MVRRPRRRWGAAGAAALLAASLALLTAPPTTAGAAAVVPAAAMRSATLALRAPSWWSGAGCDSAHWDAVARRSGWRGAGAHRLGAVYLGVPVCGPRPAIDGSPDVMWRRSGWGYPEWQCTELAFRFMAQVYGVRPYAAAGGTVVSLYRSRFGGGLVRYRNGAVGHAPQPGDVLSFTGRSIYDGHVVVVAASHVDRYGDGTLLTLSQDDTATGWRTVRVRHWRVASLGWMPAWGWLHDPRGRGR